ncbi:MAG: calcium-binding protein [Sedimentitalea sp.]
MADGILETIIEIGTEQATAFFVDQAVGPVLNDAARSEIAAVLSEAISEPLEDLVESFDILDVPDAVSDSVKGGLALLDFVQKAQKINDNPDYQDGQKQALLSLTVIETVFPWLSSDATVLAEAAVNLVNNRNAALDQLFEDNPDQLAQFNGELYLVRPGQPPERIQDILDDLEDPPTPQDLLQPAAPTDVPTPVPDQIKEPANDFGDSENLTCPLILDLLGDGIAVSALGADAVTGSSVYFDLDSDGFAERTAWVLGEGVSNETGTGGDDAYLVRDLNGNGIIDNESEMFCVTNSFATGFANLASLDGNGDGVVNSADAAFGSLQIWLDSNGNGRTDAGELQSMAHHGVASVGVVPESLPETLLNGNLITAEASFTRTDGSTGTITDMWYLNDDIDTHFTGDYTLDPRVLALPTLRGFGDLTDLHVAMSLDETLLDRVMAFRAEFSLASLADPEALNAEVTQILYHWAGVHDLDPGARGPHIDAQVLEFMEALSGNFFGYESQSTPLNPEGYWQADGVRAAYAQAFDTLKSHLIFQVGGQVVFGDDAAIYDFRKATLTPNEMTDAGLAQLVAAAEGAQSLAAANTLWLDFARMLAEVQDLDTLSPDQEAQLEQAMAATSTLTWTTVATSARNALASVNEQGTSGADQLAGAAGNDILSGLGGADYLEGGAGRDQLHGGLGKDELLGGSGDDDLHGNEGKDRLFGGSGEDRVYGNDGNDILTGGQDADQLEGGAGSDKYRWFQGHGSDTITDTGGTKDQIIFGKGIDVEDVTFALSGSHLVVTIGADQITLNHQFADYGYEVEWASFADGARISLLNDLTFTGTQGADSMSGTSGDDLLEGLDGDDTLNANEGADTLIGGHGADRLNGGVGDDIYRWSVGDGADVITDTGGVDTLALGVGISSGDVRFVRSSSDLHLFVGSEQLTLRYQFATYGYEIETLLFADGTTQSLMDALTFTGTQADESLSGLATGDRIEGLGGNDTIDAGAGNDLLIGGAGDDRLYGGADVDRYAWSLGDGSDAIYDYGETDDRLVFGTGIDADDLRLTTSGNNLQVHVGGEVLTLHQQFSTYGYGVEIARFADGSEMSLVQDLALTGTQGNDSLTGLGDANTLRGRDGVDTLNGQAGADVLIGGRGADRLYGGAGDDVYVWKQGDGSDQFYEQGGVDDTDDRLVFRANVAVEDVRYGVSSSNLLIFIGEDTLTLHNQFSSYGYQIEWAEFGDGTQVDLTGSLTLGGTDGVDSITGRVGGYSFDGKGGADTLRGTTGADRYLWGVGDGSDVIYDYGDANDTGDAVVFGDHIARGDLRFGVAGSDLLIHVAGETLTLKNQFSQQGYDIERLEFADGSAFDLGGKLVLTGTGGDETLYGTASGDVIRGMGGDDLVYGQDGDDRITGGGGNDRLQGGSGSDVYVYGVGHGSDEITDSAGAQDKLRFEGGIDAQDLRYQVSGRDLLIHVDDAVLTLKNQLNTPAAQIEQAVFDDGRRVDLTADLTFTGTDLGETVLGTGWNDTLLGLGGADTLTGGLGDDDLSGGRGGDVLTGGGGADVFRFHSAADSHAFGMDEVADFAQGLDLIDLSAIDAVRGGADDAFTFIAGHGFSGTAGELRYDLIGNGLRLLSDDDGDGIAELAVMFEGITSLSASDFVL